MLKAKSFLNVVEKWQGREAAGAVVGRTRWLSLGIFVFIGLSLVGRPASGESTVPEQFAITLKWSKPLVTLEWPTLSNQFAYTVEARGSLSPSDSWSPAPAAIWPQPASWWTDPRPAFSMQYYRVLPSLAAAERGKLLSTMQVGVLTPAEIEAGFALLGGLVPVKSGVVMTKISYETVNAFGIRTVASGLLLLPQEFTNSLPLVSYQHGTIILRNEAPSVAQGLDRVIGIALATSGYAATIPDYLGLGDSPGLHPFVHADSQAAAVVDLLRAARVHCHSLSVPLNGQVFLVGYSEGGHATMAAHRVMETIHTNEFLITASAPMAGPYDLSGVMVNDFLSGRPTDNPYYFVYLLAAYQSIYQLAPSFSELLAAPYDTTLPPLLDGKHTGRELNRAIGESPLQVLKPEFLEAFRQPDHPLRRALADNDTYGWVPKAPMRLFHCAGDEEVLFTNSQVAYDAFIRLGAEQVGLVDPLPSGSHGSCAPVALLEAKKWFDSLVLE